MKRILVSFAIALLVPAAPAFAQGYAQGWDAGQANDARQKGDIIPLKKILRMLERKYGGYHRTAELFSKPGGGSEYRIEWITGDNEHKVLFVDAQSGAIRED